MRLLIASPLFGFNFSEFIDAFPFSPVAVILVEGQGQEEGSQKRRGQYHAGPGPCPGPDPGRADHHRRRAGGGRRRQADPRPLCGRGNRVEHRQGQRRLCLGLHDRRIHLFRPPRRGACGSGHFRLLVRRDRALQKARRDERAPRHAPGSVRVATINQKAARQMMRPPPMAKRKSRWMARARAKVATA